MVSEELIHGLNLVRDILETSDTSVVVVKNSQIIGKKTGHGLRPFLELIDELGENIHGCIIGDKILGKASSLLCRYSQARAVYSPQATKTAIALLIMGGIPCQVDEMIPMIKNKSGDDMCPFEKMLGSIACPDEAYKILKEKIMK